LAPGYPDSGDHSALPVPRHLTITGGAEPDQISGPIFRRNCRCISTVGGIPISDIKTNNNRLTLDRTKEQLQQMAAYQLENPDTGAGTSTSPATGGHLGR
jgi:hypothetical protein